MDEQRWTGEAAAVPPVATAKPAPVPPAPRPPADSSRLVARSINLKREDLI